MKKYFLGLGLFAMIGAGTVSCKKMLNTEPNDFLNTDGYFNTQSELEAALAGVYSSLAQDGTYGRNIPIELEMGNDEGHYNNRNNYNGVQIGRAHV